MPTDPDAAAVPRRALLFAGHRVDAPDRPVPRFPPAHVAAARSAVDAALDALDAGASDVGYTQGAAGADLLFAEACVRRGVRLKFLQPFAEPEFIARSILSSADGELWHERYLQVRQRLAEPPQRLPALPDVPSGTGEASEGAVYERCNAWLLASALGSGAATTVLVCLWDGASGDGPGGTAHLVSEVERRGGEVVWIDSRKLTKN